MNNAIDMNKDDDCHSDITGYDVLALPFFLMFLHSFLLKSRLFNVLTNNLDIYFRST